VEVVVGPGRLDLYHSSLSIPTKADPRTIVPKILGRGCASEDDQSETCSSDELNQNPRAGPNVGGKGSKFQKSRIVYDYALSMKDAKDSPRDGTDQMLVRIKLVEKQSPRLGSSMTAQDTLPQADYSICFATRRLKDSLAGSGQPVAKDCGNIQDDHIINVGALCDKEKAGEYTFRNIMEPTSGNSLYGVFQLDVWLCPLEQFAADGDLSGCLQELNIEPDSQVKPSHSAECPDSPTPTKPASCNRAMGQPQYYSYGPDTTSLVLSPMPMIFTVCPANADTSTGRWDDQPGIEGAGFVEGPQLHTCSCKTGYMGHKGRSCEACRGGKYTSQAGSPECSDCDVGKHCACTTGYCGPGDAFPACTDCDLCQIGKYQSTPGQDKCADCKDGFNCNLMGMTYPVAYEGHYVDAKDPEQTTTCAPDWGAARPRKLDGAPASAVSMTDDQPSYPSDHTYDFDSSATAPPHLIVPPVGMTLQEWVDAAHDKTDRSTGQFTKERGRSCPGGNMSLAKELKCIFDEDSQQLVSSADGGQASDQCRLAVGSLCLEGYSGDKAAACQACDQSWYHDSATGQCYPCPNTNGKVLAAAVSILGLLIAPFILKFAEAMKHAGALQVCPVRHPQLVVTSAFQCFYFI